MSNPADKLGKIAEKIRVDFLAKDATREKVIPLCRETIRFCSQAIRAMHRQEFDNARDMLSSAQKLVTKAKQKLDDYSRMPYPRFFLDAQKEFTEGSVTLALITQQKLPDPDELEVNYAAYLNGLGEAVGEMRRYIIDSLRKGDFSRSEELLQTMDDIYDVLVTMDFPDAITNNLRHTTDMVRGVLERTRSDLTLAKQQKSLENKLEKLNREEKNS